jgi:hypothetical protein
VPTAVTAKEVATLAGIVVVCGSGQRCTAPSLVRSRRVPHQSSPLVRPKLTISGRAARWAG